MTDSKAANSYDVISNIAAAFAARPNVSIDDIVELVAKLSAELGTTEGAGAGTRNTSTAGEGTARPALPIDKAVTPDKVYCLCCGKGFKMLKRHLGSEHGLSEEEYRTLFALPPDMPLVAPRYSERKAAYAKKVGLGKYSREDGSQSVPIG